MQLYQFERIYSQMENEFGKIRRGEEIDTDKFRNEDNARLEKALLMAFDPYTNQEIMELLKQQIETDEFTQDMLRSYYKFPIMCLLRIKNSIDTWEKQFGANGYFDFVESYMGNQIKGTEMNFSIMSSGLGNAFFENE